ncbi:hypothetical protein [Acinetobacter larvae]|uniref:Lipoprotein n=1 Tax=Acinetobacter larvae TaxID=1789224 RepID=A0A1B2LYF1_9GAMM|nr:hypothetical protein [Acinetobacter larvae]AOA57909.1 hypothetical protein BFG52_05785 [Acinetobacter larvae]
MTLNRCLILISSVVVLSACHSNSVNRLVYNLESPQGAYHVEVRQCRENDAMFGPATKLQVSLLRTGESENCRATIKALSQFNVNQIDQQLQLQWLSESELRAWHPSFKANGPREQFYIQNPHVRIVFTPQEHP